VGGLYHPRSWRLQSQRKRCAYSKKSKFLGVFVFSQRRYVKFRGYHPLNSSETRIYIIANYLTVLYIKTTMPKRYPQLVPQKYYHVFNRGNRKENIFNGKDDYERFLKKFQHYWEKYPIEVYSYCLLSNHFHFEVMELSDQGNISKLFGCLLNSHTRYVNLRYEKVGHVFQGRFRSKLIESEASLLYVSKYIHLNPIKDKILGKRFIRKGDSRKLETLLKRRIREYEWSSYRYYYNRDKASMPGFLNVSKILEIAGGKVKYRKYAELEVTQEEISRIEALDLPRIKDPAPGVDPV
jgi:putative transposase